MKVDKGAIKFTGYTGYTPVTVSVTEKPLIIKNLNTYLHTVTGVTGKFSPYTRAREFSENRKFSIESMCFSGYTGYKGEKSPQTQWYQELSCNRSCNRSVTVTGLPVTKQRKFYTAA